MHELIREAEERSKRNNSFHNEQWLEAISVKTVTNPHLKEMILNYFISEGYESAAAQFAQEAGLGLGQRNIDLIRIKDRIRKALHQRKISEVVSELNQFDPTILQNNSELSLMLNLVTFCGLIQQQQFDEALLFIQEKAKPFLDANQHTALIEEHLLLLLFKDQSKGPAANLLTESRLLDLNTRINKELNQRMDAEIIILMKLMKWMEKRLNDKFKVPKLTNLSKLQFSLQ